MNGEITITIIEGVAIYVTVLDGNGDEIYKSVVTDETQDFVYKTLTTKAPQIKKNVYVDEPEDAVETDVKKINNDDDDDESLNDPEESTDDEEKKGRQPVTPVKEKEHDVPKIGFKSKTKSEPVKEEELDVPKIKPTLKAKAKAVKGPVIHPCTMKIKRGKRKGQFCGYEVFKYKKCSRHWQIWHKKNPFLKYPGEYS